MRHLLSTILLLTLALSATAQVSKYDNFTIDEAKEYIADAADHIRGVEPLAKGYSAGRFEVIANEGKYSKNPYLHALTFPVKAENNYIAMRKNKKGKVLSEVPVTFRYVITKGRSKNLKKNQYIIALIPSKSYYKKWGDNYGERFIHPEDIGEFDGVTITMDPKFGSIITGTTYVEGLRANMIHTTIQRVISKEPYLLSPKTTYEEGFEIVKQEILTGIEFRRVE